MSVDIDPIYPTVIIGIICVIAILFIANIPGPTAAMYAISHDVPTNILIGGIDDSENRWIVDAYIDGRKDAKAGNEPFSCCVPQPYHYGYCHGYADYSDLDFMTVLRVADENTWASIREEDVNDG